MSRRGGASSGRENSRPIPGPSIEKAKIRRKEENSQKGTGGIQSDPGPADIDRQHMRNFPSDSKDMPRVPDAHRGGEWARRTPADYAGVLLELARAQRGFLFYDETDARRRPLAERAHRAICSELARAGEIELLMDASGPRFLLPDEAAPIDASGALLDFERALRSHGVKRLRLDPTLTETALAGLFDLLGQGEDRYPSPDHLARTLAARDTRGIRINDLDGESGEIQQDLNTTPLRARAFLAPTPHDSRTTPATRDDDTPKVTLEEDPLRAPAGDDRGERLRARLIELHATSEDPRYLEQISDLTVWAADLWRNDQVDECYRAMLVLADHAVGGGGRSEAQARAAEASFAELTQGDRLDHLIDRATRGGSPGVRAAQLLLQLGPLAVPAIFARLAAEENEDHAAQLRALVLTLGESAMPALLAAIESHDLRQACAGIRLAGEMQNPAVLPALLRSLDVPDLSRRIETIRALSLLPGEESTIALTQALDSDLEEIVAAACEGLANLEGQHAVPALLDILESSLQKTQTRVSCKLVQVFGRLGDERAVPRLCAILERRPVLRRAHWQSVQLVAIDALAVLPTKEARRCIERAALHGTQTIRVRATAALQTIA